MRLIEGEYAVADPAILKLSTRTSDLVLSVCRELGLSSACCLYALWVFHANSVVLGFKRMDRFLYGCASVLLGSKLGDCLKRVDDIVMLWRRQLKRLTCKEHIEDDEETIRGYKKALFETEVHLMTSIAFDLDIKLATNYLRLLESHVATETLVNAEKCVRDFYRTQLVVYFEPHLIALASLQSACRVMSSQLGKLNGRIWYQFFSEETRLEEVEQLNHLLLTIFQATQE